MSAPILIVDDDEVLLRVLGRILKGYGYQVLQATEPAPALGLVRQHRPGLALLDLCMPGADGVELGRQLRAEQPDLVLILMTAYPFRLRDHPAAAENFARVLVKPLDLAVLREAVEAVLPRDVNGAGAVKLS